VTVARFIRENAMLDGGMARVPAVSDLDALRHEFAEPLNRSAAQVFINPVVGRAVVNDEQADALVAKDVIHPLAVLIEVDDNDALDGGAHDAKPQTVAVHS
jgi:hypothetical protein